MEYRNTILSFINASSVTLNLVNLNVVQGVVLIHPPPTVPAGGYTTFQVQNVDGTLVGPQGSVMYQNAEKTVSVQLVWDHSFGPTSSYSVLATPSSMWATYYPNPITDHQQAVCFWLSPTPFPYQNWMRDNWSLLSNKYIYDICMPGTHDSGTYSLVEEVAPSAPDFVKDLQKLTGDAFMSIVMSWSVAQPQCTTIYDQLMLGVRYIDVRVDYDVTQDLLRIAHGLFGTSIKDVLNQIAQFAAYHPDEFLVIAFNALDDMDDDHNDLLVSMIQQSFGNALVNKANATTPLAQLKATPQRIFLIYCDDDMVDRNAFLISESFLYSPWANTDSVPQLKTFLDSTIADRPDDTLFVLQGQLTDNNDTIINGVLNPDIGTTPHSLQELAWASNINLISWMATDWGKTSFNIVFADFLAASVLIPACIARNQWQPTLGKPQENNAYPMTCGRFFIRLSRRALRIVFAFFAGLLMVYLLCSAATKTCYGMQYVQANTALTA